MLLRDQPLTSGLLVVTKFLHDPRLMRHSKKNISVVTKFEIFANPRSFLEIRNILEALKTD